VPCDQECRICHGIWSNAYMALLDILNGLRQRKSEFSVCMSIGTSA
jgi:predicted glycosyl hydrolase (DUF1957 family)